VGLSARAFAKKVGVSHTSVLKRMKAGTLSVLPDGTLDERVAVREWTLGKGQTNTGTPGVGEPGAVSTQASARAALMVYKAQLAQIELQVKRGELVNAADHRAAAYTTARTVRDLLLSVPARLAPVVAGLGGSPEDCYAAIEREMFNVVDQLAALRPPGANGNGNGTGEAA